MRECQVADPVWAAFRLTATKYSPFELKPRLTVGNPALKTDE
jgi:hypothetical protein